MAQETAECGSRVNPMVIQYNLAARNLASRDRLPSAHDVEAHRVPLPATPDSGCTDRPTERLRPEFCRRLDVIDIAIDQNCRSYAIGARSYFRSAGGLRSTQYCSQIMCPI